MTIHKADNLESAISLAEDLKTQGHYDWFRGQNHGWPLCPSLNRLTEERRNDALVRSIHFGFWLKSIPGLEGIDADDEAKLAVAQHYGIPTHFVDFTTEPRVAAFFASHGASVAENPEGYILCLNTADLEKFWSEYYPTQPEPRFVTIHVPDLWRLQAQCGVFLDCPYANLEDVYPIDRIVFPQSEQKSPIEESDIYPIRKSRLEQFLEQYFDTERQRNAFKWLHESGHIKNAILDFRSPEKANESIVPAGEIPTHESWETARLTDWYEQPDEKYQKSEARETHELVLDLSKCPIKAGKIAAAEIFNLLTTFTKMRTKLITWSLHFDSASLSIHRQQRILGALHELWDGIRSLPYKDEEIASSIGTYITMELLYDGINNHQPESWEKVAALCFGNVIEVEFGGAGGGSSRAFVTEKDVKAAIRKDLGKYIARGYKKWILGDVRQALSLVPAPNRLFDFNLLAKIFVRQIAPFQLCGRYTPPRFYSPAGLRTFGLP